MYRSSAPILRMCWGLATCRQSLPDQQHSFEPFTKFHESSGIEVLQHIFLRLAFAMQKESVKVLSTLPGHLPEHLQELTCARQGILNKACFQNAIGEEVLPPASPCA